ncbi:hypothetical protein C2845_PM05G32990 [Panicum miliaceum]|uniref:Uncharacterized protein n=1 Tax=Panicum miliaceum TaxID=4540 RepID=A0A3L6T119_PANMI|nr:hypothetical protein C2845_PM05G32990 [Panicum miliaceum]
MKPDSDTLTAETATHRLPLAINTLSSFTQSLSPQPLARFTCEPASPRASIDQRSARSRQMAATMKLRILAVAAAASCLVATASAAEGPAPAPTSGASMAAPAVSAASLTALVFGYLF